jgi:hypothetical protein
VTEQWRFQRPRPGSEPGPEARPPRARAPSLKARGQGPEPEHTDTHGWARGQGPEPEHTDTHGINITMKT